MKPHDELFHSETVDEQVDQFLQIPQQQGLSASAEMVQALQKIYAEDPRLQRVWKRFAQHRAIVQRTEEARSQHQTPSEEFPQILPTPIAQLSQKEGGSTPRSKRRRAFQRILEPLAAVILIVMLVGSLIAVLHLWHQIPSGQTGARRNTSTERTGKLLSTQPLTQIAMLDVTHGWALDNSTVLKTSDGGKSWVSLIQGNRITAGSHAEFFNAQDAWIVVPDRNGNGVTVYFTTTGGASWNSTPIETVAPNGGAITFINPKIGWITIAPGGAGAGSEPIDIFQTIDGGVTWKKIASSGTAADDLPIGGIKSGFSFIDPMTGWATGTDASNTPWLYVTHDGGKTWHKQTITGLPDGSLANYQTMPPVFFGKTGFLPLTITSSSTSFVLLQTNDGGQTWSAKGQAMVSMVTSNASVANLEFAWATDQNSGNVFRTQDGGKHWQEVANQVGITGMLSFVDNETGFAIGNANQIFLKRTNDGGKTWHTIVYKIYA